MAMSNNCSSIEVETRHEQHHKKSQKTALLTLTNALSGDFLGNLLFDPAWTALRLKTEIAHELGISTMEQRLLHDQTLDAILDEAIVGELFAHGEVARLKLLRSDVSHTNKTPKSIAIDMSDGFCRVEWTIDARKLRTNVNMFTSPSFELDCGILPQPAKFILMIYGQSGGSFKHTRGKGHVQLKCDNHLGCEMSTSINVSIGSGTKCRPSKGPFQHNFEQHAAWRSSTLAEEGFDFASVVEKATSSFTVCLTIDFHGTRRSMIS